MAIWHTEHGTAYADTFIFRNTSPLGMYFGFGGAGADRYLITGAADLRWHMGRGNDTALIETRGFADLFPGEGDDVIRFRNTPGHDEPFAIWTGWTKGEGNHAGDHDRLYLPTDGRRGFVSLTQNPEGVEIDAYGVKMREHHFDWTNPFEVKVLDLDFERLPNGRYYLAHGVYEDDRVTLDLHYARPRAGDPFANPTYRHDYDKIVGGVEWWETLKHFEMMGYSGGHNLDGNAGPVHSGGFML